MENFQLETETVPCEMQKRWVLQITIKQWSNLIAHLTYGFPKLDLTKEARQESKSLGGLLAAGVFRHNTRELVSVFRVKNGKNRTGEFARIVNEQLARLYPLVHSAALAEGVEPRITEVVELMGQPIIVERVISKDIPHDYTVRCYSRVTSPRRYM